MPNTKAKNRKRKKTLLNKKWSIEGRTNKHLKKAISDALAGDVF
jgi:hypothetical protein